MKPCTREHNVGQVIPRYVVKEDSSGSEISLNWGIMGCCPLEISFDIFLLFLKGAYSAIVVEMINVAEQGNISGLFELCDNGHACSRSEREYQAHRLG